MVPHVVALMVKKTKPGWITWSSVCAAVCCQARSCSAWLLKAAPAMEMVVVMWLMEYGWQVKPQRSACCTQVSLGLCVRMGPGWCCKSPITNLSLLLSLFLLIIMANLWQLKSHLCPSVVLDGSSLHKGSGYFEMMAWALRKELFFPFSLRTMRYLDAA